MSKDFSLDDVNVSLTPQERFEEYLQSRGMRKTEQRRILVDFVFSQHDHFDADTLMEKLPRRGTAGYVSRPTVYRTLAEFVDAGLLRKLDIGGRTVYEHDYGYPQHDHLYCETCHNLIEFKSDELIELRKHVSDQHGFHVSGHRWIITGICQPCQQASRKRVRRKQDLI